jgi:hypothetical protein
MSDDIRERLLLAELQQNYSWMQEMLKQFLSWYAFFFTVNVGLMGYLIKGEAKKGSSPLPPLMIFLAVCGLVLVGVGWRYFVSADARVKSLVQQLNNLTGGPNGFAMRSVFPRGALAIGFLFLAFGLVAVTVAWSILLK